MRVFKVFSACKGRLESAVVTGDLRVRYEPGKWTGGWQGTPVLAFKTLRDAVRFVRAGVIGLDEFEIWECEAEDICDVKALVFHPIFECDIQVFWDEFSSGIKEPSVPLAVAPRGTVACSRVKPVRLVEKYEVDDF